MNYALKNLEEARQLALKMRPWYCPFLVRFQFVQRDNQQGLFHDIYGRIYFNEGYASFTKSEVLAVSLLQIAEMFTRGYHLRGRGRHPMLWNFACLLDTASSLQKQGFELPRESLKPGWFKFPSNKSAEYYYRLLEEKDRFTIPFTAIDQYGRPQSVNIDMWFEDGKLFFSQEEFAVVGGMGDTPEDLEGLTFLLDPLLMSGIQHEVFDAAAEFGEHLIGDAPDWLVRKSKAEESIIPWHEHVLTFLGDKDSRGASAVKYSFLQRSLLSPLLPPTMVFPHVVRKSPKLVIIVDTSASMDQQLLGRALGETDGLMRSLQIDDGLTIIPTDAAAHTVQKVFRASHIHLEGNGGTDLGKGLEKIEELNEKPDAAIIFTDGYTPWPKEAPAGYDVMVVVVSKKWPEPNEKKRHPAPTWAKVVEMFPYRGAA